LAAIYAIIRINPAEVRDYVSFLNYGPVFPPDMKQIQAASKSSTIAIVSVFEPLLEDPKITRRILAADVMLMFAPDNQKARKALQKIMVEGELKDRVAAAHLLWKHTGEFEEVLLVLQEGLNAEDRFTFYSAIQYVGEMGTTARPAIPALKAMLWHKEYGVRSSAGKTLRKLAPDEMPPIH
jgi:HEAT repeat protein